MPALVNYSGDDEFYSGGSFYTNPVDLGRFYNPPCKRARISAPFLFGSAKFEQDKRPSIDVLPDECLFEIFRRIPGGKERSSCAGVSKRWLMLLSSISRAETYDGKSTATIKEMAVPAFDDVQMVNEEIESDGHLTRSLEGKKATDLRLAAIAVGTNGRGGLGKLLIRGSNPFRGVTNFGLAAVARGCPSLRVLSLCDVPLVGDEGLLELAKECHLLEKLDICNCPSISNKGLISIAENCPNLTSLTIESCPKIGNEGLQAVGKFCPNLQSISIKDCPLIGDSGLSSLVSSTSSVLSKVKLQGLKITDFSLVVIGHYGKSVANLVLHGLQHVSERGFWVMGNAQGLQKLVSLTITSCQGMTDVSLEAVAKGCTSLKHICLRKCCFVSDNGLINFAKAVGSLESLQLEECNRISQLGVLSAISSCGERFKALSLVKCTGIRDVAQGTSAFSPCNSLRSLSIRNCPGFGNTTLAMVGKLCPQLQNVDLSGLCGITDSGLLPLLESCEAGLVKVNLGGCLGLTDEVVVALVTLHGSTIECLNLDGCRRITDSSLAAIAKSCLFLSDLDVSKCGITDFGIAVLSSAEQLNLQVLSLSGCSQVSSKSYSCLKKLGRTLVGLNLQNCSSISGKIFGLLVENLWCCDVLF
ncbi:hypothetical protein K2173_021008 [Erythroxylum novogranatense]|uniref:F-box domain-containing protein n=1 Tax=Erythroxylum novogranatense TaxID=1862640 RepID=A0AAV8TPE6_9ROSI|nr:hypothetical protein K2173_021008 [Erythroxylum novogranatense]